MAFRAAFGAAFEAAFAMSFRAAFGAASVAAFAGAFLAAFGVVLELPWRVFEAACGAALEAATLKLKLWRPQFGCGFRRFGRLLPLPIR